MRADLSMSDAFYKKLAEIIEANLENEQFGVEDLVREIGLSRSQVHRKLHEDTGQSISQFIREIRLQRAHEMLVDGVGTVSEVAYKVGFGSPTYFNKCFVEHYGYTPGDAKYKSANGATSLAQSHPTKRHAHTKNRLGKVIILAIAVFLVTAGWLIYENMGEAKISFEDTRGIAENAIAVLYFDNISGDPSQDYLSDGVTDEIISRLSMIRGLRVPGLSSVKPFRGKSIPLAEIANQLNVDVVLEGTVKKSSDKLRITARLVDIPNNNTLWTEVYERDYLTAEIFEIQSNIAISVARRFQFMITPTLESSEPPTQSIEAYDLFLQATSRILAFGIRMPTGYLDRSESQLKRVIKIDPEFAKAYLELAKIYNYKYLGSVEGAAKYDSIKTLVRIASAKDPRMAEAYIHLASLSSSKNMALPFFTYRTSINDSTWIWLKKAYDLDPVEGLTGYGNLYASTGNWPVAVQCYNEVLRLNPWQRDALIGKAIIFGNMDLPDSSRKYLSLLENLDPINAELASYQMNISLMIHKYILNEDYAGFHELLARYYENDQQSIDYRMGIVNLFGKRFKEAEKYYQASGYRDMDVGLLLLETGRSDSGRHLLTQALDLRLKLKDRVFLFDLVRIYAVLGRSDEAVHSFKKSISSGFRDIAWINHDPFIDYIRDDPEFKKVFRQLLDENQRMYKRIKELEDEPFDLDHFLP